MFIRKLKGGGISGTCNPDDVSHINWKDNVIGRVYLKRIAYLKRNLHFFFGLFVEKQNLLVAVGLKLYDTKNSYLQLVKIMVKGWLEILGAL